MYSNITKPAFILHFILVEGKQYYDLKLAIAVTSARWQNRSLVSIPLTATIILAIHRYKK